MAEFTSFSIVIPSYARPERLTRCLEALTQLVYPADYFEVIVVDDGSNPSLEPVVTPFLDRLPLTLLRQSNAGPASARNRGAAQAKGQYLVFTDDDCTPQPQWLSTLHQQVSQTPGCLIGGQTLNALPDNLFSTASQVLIDYLYTYYNQDAGLSNFFASNNLAVPTDRFHALGGFDTSFPLAAGEDREFCDRWLHHGYGMIYASEMQIYHAHHLTLSSFWRQHFNYGRGAYCFHQARAQRSQTGVKVEPLTFYSRLLTFPLRHRSPIKGVLLSSLLLVSQIANVSGFFWERSHQPSSRLNWA